MDAADLRLFEAVARLEVMNRAASELNTVQSNVSARVRLLEEELKTTLFQRTRRGVALTAAGRRLLPYARRLQHLLDDARRAVQDNGTPRGSLAIGSAGTTATLRLPPILAAYAAANPEVDVMLATGASPQLVEDVLARHLEGAFVCGPVDHPELQEEPIFREELVVVTPRSIRSVRDVGTRADVKIVVLSPRCSYGQRLESILNKRGVVPSRRLTFGTIDAVLRCVMAGLGVTLLPKQIVTPASRNGQVAIHALSAAEGTVDTMFVRRRDAFVSSALAAFLNFAREQASRAPERRRSARSDRANHEQRARSTFEARLGYPKDVSSNGLATR